MKKTQSKLVSECLLFLKALITKKRRATAGSADRDHLSSLLERQPYHMYCPDTDVLILILISSDDQM